MFTSHLVALLILLYACPVFNSESDQDIDGNATSTTCWPKLNRMSFWSGIIGIGYEHGDDCPQDAFLVPTFPDDLDMKKMMGRWIIGIVSHRYSYHDPSSRKCIIYDFGQLILVNHSTSFNVTRTYQASTHKIGQNKIWKNSETNIGFMRSCGPINAKLMYKNPENSKRLETKFFIYNVGPQGKNSFGRPQYEYAVIGGCEKHPVLVIARNPKIFTEKYKKEVMKWFEDNGIRKDWIQTDYSDCSFDSTTHDIEHLI